ncbi:MAG TPA: phage tail protein [Allosphingosinicella sp.]|jgi:phage-related protein
MTDTFTWRALTATSGDGKFTTNAAKFGDNYSQRSANGINNSRETYRVVVDGTREEMEACIAWIKAKAGVVAFFWKPPLSVRGLYICTGWTPEIEGVLCRLNLEFEQVGTESMG